MNKINEWVNSLDERVNPNTGNLLRKIFKVSTLLLITLGLFIIVIVVGSLAVVRSIQDSSTDSWFSGADTNLYLTWDTSLSTAAIICIGFIPWFVLVLISGSGWFYFSKWTEATDNE